ncbi:MAG: hypothetical protein H7641_06680 [Candidatus Heimdallarchaeota archaeon]|nr:hypothetical protein [Candidatus Heimdallarchaeota archaeon]MCK4877249.1 hypothetical protein [Candidatus Heimdallarchaeota archaeon]
MEDDEIVTPYLSEEITLTKFTPLRTIWEMVRITAWQNFAHHPTCSQYKKHYFSIGKVKLCVGCTSFYSMVIASLIAFFAAYDFFRANAIILPIVYVYGIIAFGMHLLTRPEKKWLKSIFRGSLGLGAGAYIAVIVLGPVWWIRLILLAFIPFEIALFFTVRGKRANLAICDDCPLHTAEPPCDPMKNTEIRINNLNSLIDSQINGLKVARQKALEEKSRESEINNSEALEEKEGEEA